MSLIRTIYLYLFALVGLFVTVFGLISLLQLGLNTYVFKVDETAYVMPISKPAGATPTTDEQAQIDQAKKQATNNQHRQANQALAMILVGVPLYWYHWSVIKSDHSRKGK